MVSSKRYAGTKAIVKAMNQIMQALSPVSQIKTTVPACENNFGWTFLYSSRTNNAASSAKLASTKATQQPRNPAPLKRAPYTPGAFKRIW